MMLDLLDARVKLAAALAPIADGDPDVLVDLVDSLEPPALMLGWGDPWLDPDTQCFDDGLLLVTAVAARLVPGEGVAMLEQLVAYTRRRLLADPIGWPRARWSAPRVFTIGNVNYLASRGSLAVKVTINGGP